MYCKFILLKSNILKNLKYIVKYINTEDNLPQNLEIQNETKTPKKQQEEDLKLLPVNLLRFKFTIVSGHLMNVSTITNSIYAGMFCNKRKTPSETGIPNPSMSNGARPAEQTSPVYHLSRWRHLRRARLQLLFGPGPFGSVWL